MREYLQIKIASPQQILKWSERLLPNNKLIGEIKKPMKIDNNLKTTKTNIK